MKNIRIYEIRISWKYLPKLSYTYPAFRNISDIHSYPSSHTTQVLLKYDGESLCGGVLVDANWILTAGHCVDKRDKKYLKVIAGTYCLFVHITLYYTTVSSVVIKQLVWLDKQCSKAASQSVRWHGNTIQNFCWRSKNKQNVLPYSVWNVSWY